MKGGACVLHTPEIPSQDRAKRESRIRPYGGNDEAIPSPLGDSDSAKVVNQDSGSYDRDGGIVD